jgi:HEPN domain-containing protein
LPLPETEEANLLLRKAVEDRDAVAKLAADSDIADSVIGFHAQQTVEKAIKAVLASCGDEFPWTHDLRHLIERLDALRRSLPPSLDDVRELAPWAVEFRYGETIDDLLDRHHALALAEQVVEWARAEVRASTRTQRVTEHDRKQGALRVPACAKWLFPAEPAQLVVVLQGIHLDNVRWDPRLGLDRERSGVLGIGRDAASNLKEDEQLEISRAEGGVQLH